MKDREKIVARIKALLSKTIDNGATKQEMESALNKANQLMLEFFISENEIKDDNVISKCISEEFKLIKTGFDLSLFYNDLAKLFDCQYYYNKYRIVFFGHQQDVSMCGYFYNLISKTCLIEKDNYIKSDEYQRLKKSYHGKTLSSSFIKGFLIEISLKLRNMYKERKSNIPEVYALVVIEKIDKVKKEFQELDLNIKKVASKKLTGEKEAFEYGIEKGKNIKLVQGVETANNVKNFYLN